MFRKSDLIKAITITLGLGCAWQASAALAQNVLPVSKDNAVLVVEGVVQEVFSSPRQTRTDYVVQIEVRRSDSLKASNTAARFPAPGEVIYAHVFQQPKVGLAATKGETYTA